MLRRLFGNGLLNERRQLLASASDGLAQPAVSSATDRGWMAGADDGNAALEGRRRAGRAATGPLSMMGRDVRV